jgi:hypothetical protein
MASNQDEGRRQAMLEKQRKDMMDDIARQKEALQQVRNESFGVLTKADY